MDIEKKYKMISGFLLVVILGLGYWLYLSIVEPYEKQRQKQEITEMTHQRMSDIRDLLITVESKTDKFPGSLDSLIAYVKQDSALLAIADTSYNGSFKNKPFYLDSLIYTIRPPKQRFEYTLNDTIRPNIYLLQDPATKDRIGSLERTTQLNAASWE